MNFEIISKNYFTDIEHVGKYSWAAISLWNNFEIIPGMFPSAEIKLFQTHVDEIIILKKLFYYFTRNRGGITDGHSIVSPHAYNYASSVVR